jgi:hypothetical protein
MICSTQIVHQSCVKICTISKWTKRSFYFSLVYQECHRVRPKQFLSLYYVWCKLCTYLAPTLTLSLNEPKRDFTWHYGSSIGCIQNDFWAYGTFYANCAPILHRHWHYLQTGRNEIPDNPRHLGVLSGASKTISEPHVRLAQTVHLSCIQTDQNGIRYDPRHVGLPYSVSEMISEPMVRMAQTVHLSCVKITTRSKWTKTSCYLSLVT